MERMLIEMRTSGPQVSVWLYASAYSSGQELWTGSYEVETKELNLKFKRSGPTPVAAVEALYTAFRNATTKPVLTPLALSGPREVDDEIPF